MDLYRITRTDPITGRPRVQYGTMVRVRAIERTVRQVNDDRDGIRAWIDSNPERYGQWDQDPKCYEHIVLTVERAVITDWDDVTESVIKP